MFQWWSDIQQSCSVLQEFIKKRNSIVLSSWELEYVCYRGTGELLALMCQQSLKVVSKVTGQGMQD